MSMRPTSLGSLLDANGHSVRTCFDGSSAFEAAAELVPEVAFIDLNMPHPDGIELAKMIRGAAVGRECEAGRSHRNGAARGPGAHA
jgi:CheY-like chemotaxis protein